MTASIAASPLVRGVSLCVALSVSLVVCAASQPQSANTSPSKPVASSTLPDDYVIGVEDILSVVFWRDTDLSAEVVVRPDLQEVTAGVLDGVRAARVLDDVRPGHQARRGAVNADACPADVRAEPRDNH